jgi:nonsense-mediated mRNA decay protein 3
LIAPNPSNLCINCIRNDVDITDGIPKQATIHFCKGCERYLQPPNIWIVAQLESRELLALCLKKLKGLKAVRLIDAGFIWTEPHSRRIKVKLTVQKEVYAATILQQIFVVEFMVAYQQCEECTRLAAQLTWKAMIQVRQKVTHKRTLFWLEQVILKHNAHRDTTNIKEAKDGIDFYYVQRSHAIKMVDFLQNMVPIRCKGSEQLISSDIHSGTSNYKFSYSVEIVPICKDDLVCLPTRLAKSMSDISPLVICHRVSNVVSFIDPNTLKVCDMRASTYFEHPFTSLCEARDLVEFYVIDVQLENVQHGKFVLASVEVAPTDDLSTTFFCRTHLGAFLHPGDHVSGYFLKHRNFNNPQFDELETRIANSSRQAHLGGGIPDVVLIRKAYPNARKRAKNRKWRLKNLAKEKEDEVLAGKANDKDRAEQDYEHFLRDLEEDADLRAMVNLYKDPRKMHQPAIMDMTDAETDIEGDDLPEISLDDLLDDMDALNLQDEEGDIVM